MSEKNKKEKIEVENSEKMKTEEIPFSLFMHAYF